MSLDAILGDGATDAFIEAMTLPDNKPSVMFSDWEYSAIEPLQTSMVNVTNDPSQSNWPGTGVWKLALVNWSDVSQQVFFQDKVICWGNGLCQSNGGVAGDSLQRMANAKLWGFLSEYADEMRIELPNVKAFYQTFLNGGFEMLLEEPNRVQVVAYIAEGSKMDDLFKWRIAGSIPEDEPAWRIARREESQ